MAVKKRKAPDRIVDTTHHNRSVTSYDVALRAGVSQSAVSRCFKPGASVSAAMRARVLKATRELNYTPNAIARSLITRRSNLVAVLISNLTNLYYPEVLSELCQQFEKRGMRVLLFTLPHEADVDKMIAQVWEYQVDGVVAAVRFTPQQVAEFERRRIPFVLYNRSLQDKPVNAVVCDQIGGARILVTRLAAAGHKRFAVISGPRDSVVGQERTKGACERIAELGLREPLVVEGNYDYDSGARGRRDPVFLQIQLGENVRREDGSDRPIEHVDRDVAGREQRGEQDEVDRPQGSRWSQPDERSERGQRADDDAAEKNDVWETSYCPQEQLAERRAIVGRFLQLGDAAVDQVEAHVALWRRRPVSWHGVTRQIDREARHIRLTHTSTFGDCFDHVAILIARGEGLPRVAIRRVLAQHPLHHALVLHERAPVEAGDGPEAGNAVRHHDLRQRRALCRTRHRLLSAQSFIVDPRLEPDKRGKGTSGQPQSGEKA